VPRHRTLRELIDWSHALCTESERVLWARVSVFAGGFDLHAVEAVCATDDLPRHMMVELVDGLVEKSVLIREEYSDHARYRILETIRDYGYDRLAGSGELLAFRRRHRDHYLDLTARAQARWFGPEQAAWFTRRRLDHANLRAALDYCLEVLGDAEAGMALAVAPRHYWITLGSLNEGRHWLARLLAADGADGLGSAVHAAALGTYGYLGILRGASSRRCRWSSGPARWPSATRTSPRSPGRTTTWPSPPRSAETFPRPPRGTRRRSEAFARSVIWVAPSSAPTNSHSWWASWETTIGPRPCAVSARRPRLRTASPGSGGSPSSPGAC
jgi:hypothetical protein